MLPRNRSIVVLDRDALRKEIVDLKDAFPHERQIFVFITERSTLQHVVDVMDIVRSAHGRMLFDDVTWVSRPY